MTSFFIILLVPFHSIDFLLPFFYIHVFITENVFKLLDLDKLARLDQQASFRLEKIPDLFLKRHSAIQFRRNVN